MWVNDFTADVMKTSRVTSLVSLHTESPYRSALRLAYMPVHQGPAQWPLRVRIDLPRLQWHNAGSGKAMMSKRIVF